MFNHDWSQTFSDGNIPVWENGFRNNTIYVSNNGYPGGRDKVNIYWGSHYTGAYACIGPGDGWDLYGDWFFTWTRNGDRRGHWEKVLDNAASSRWVHTCANETW